MSQPADCLCFFRLNSSPFYIIDSISSRFFHFSLYLELQLPCKLLSLSILGGFRQLFRFSSRQLNDIRRMDSEEDHQLLDGRYTVYPDVVALRIELYCLNFLASDYRENERLALKTKQTTDCHAGMLLVMLALLHISHIRLRHIVVPGSHLCSSRDLLMPQIFFLYVLSTHSHSSFASVGYLI